MLRDVQDLENWYCTRAAQGREHAATQLLPTLSRGIFQALSLCWIVHLQCQSGYCLSARLRGLVECHLLLDCKASHHHPHRSLLRSSSLVIMKLIIVGGTGMVATELIRQSLAMPEITSVVAVARKAVKLDENAVHKAKFKSLLIKDYEEYPDTLKAEFAGAAACIWQVHSSFIFCFCVANIIHRTVAITPFRLSKFEFAEVKRVCQTCAVAGLKAICEANPTSLNPSPTKFIYMSAEGTPQDLTKKPFLMGDYQIMRVSQVKPSRKKHHLLLVSTHIHKYLGTYVLTSILCN